MTLKRIRPLLMVGLTLSAAASAPAFDLSIFEFPDGIFAVAPTMDRLHRVEIPGGKILRTEVVGSMARVDAEHSVSLVASIPLGVAGRQVTQDMGAVRQIAMGSGIAVVAAESGTGLYYPAADKLMGLRISEGLPQAIIIHGDLVAMRWGNVVSLFGNFQGYLYRQLLKLDGLRDLHVGENTVVSLWGNQGTVFHTLGPRGFATVQLSSGMPGKLSARSGESIWNPILGAGEKVGELWDQPQYLQ